MTQKDGYQQYLDQSATAANSVGGVHHDPAVQARQATMNGGHMPSRSGGGVEGGGQGFLLLLAATPFIFAGVSFYQAFVEWVTFSPFRFASGGLVFDNLIVDGIFNVVVTLLLTYFVARSLGYFVAVGWLTGSCREGGGNLKAA